MAEGPVKPGSIISVSLSSERAQVVDSESVCFDGDGFQTTRSRNTTRGPGKTFT